VKELKCKHDFHSKCISDWLGINRSCPLCKADLSVNVKHTATSHSANHKKAPNIQSSSSESVNFVAYLNHLEEDELEGHEE
jgi:hypothetical protein